MLATYRHWARRSTPRGSREPTSPDPRRGWLAHAATFRRISPGERRALFAGDLEGPKARVLLQIALGAGLDPVTALAAEAG
jgi:hypothetical protein